MLAAVEIESDLETSDLNSDSDGLAGAGKWACTGAIGSAASVSFHPPRRWDSERLTGPMLTSELQLQYGTCKGADRATKNKARVKAHHGIDDIGHDRS